jgi:SAM-dependent methyltransferase
MGVTYYPGIFDVKDIPHAMGIVLTPEDGNTEQRWQVETPYVADLIEASIEINADTILVDYGCGIGRMAKELIARHGCSVIGVDISHSMRVWAAVYVGSDRFCSCSPTMFDVMLGHGFKADGAISIWVLQHCLKPAEDVSRLHRGLKAGAGLFVLNNNGRAVPTVERGWVNDRIDIKAILNKEFMVQEQGRLPLAKTVETIARVAFWASYRRRDSDGSIDDDPPRL